MIEKLARLMIPTRDSEAALTFYTEKLGMEIRTDVDTGNGRFVTVAPSGQADVEFMFATSDWFQGTQREEWEHRIGKDMYWIFKVDDCRATYAALQAKGVDFVEEPTQQPWGMQATFKDADGNRFGLLEYDY